MMNGRVRLPTTDLNQRSHIVIMTQDYKLTPIYPVGSNLARLVDS